MIWGRSVDRSISVAAYETLNSHFGVNADNRVCHMMMQVVESDETVMQKLDFDTRSINPDPL